MNLPKKRVVTVTMPDHDWQQHHVNPLGFWQRDCRSCCASQYRSRILRRWSAVATTECRGLQR